jgi:hypothetical protein
VRPAEEPPGERQLAALGRVGELLRNAGVDHWLFGGWAVDLYVGAVTRAHDDIDLAVWLADASPIAELLVRDGWRHAPVEDEDGGTGYERDAVRLELTYLVHTDDGRVATPFRHGPGVWPDGAFREDVRELRGVCCRLVALDALVHGKSSPRGGAEDMAKDRADVTRLSRLRP